MMYTMKLHAATKHDASVFDLPRTDGNLSIEAQKDALAMAVSSLLGGLGSFRGKLLVP